MNPSNYKRDDEYETPAHVWADILHLLPKDKVYYDPFYNSGSVSKVFKDLGLNVIHEDTDFFETVDKLDFDIIISNPPFSKKKEVLNKLFDIGKPFVLIMPVTAVCTKAYERFIGEGSIGVPPRRIQYIKDSVQTKNCSFDSFYYFWKFPGLPKLFKIV